MSQPSYRRGVLTVVSADVETAVKVMSQVKIAVRTAISNPPAHGEKIVTTVLSNPELRAEWVAEVAEMRDRIKNMRELFVSKLNSLGCAVDFSFINTQYGMFSFSGLSPEQVATLKKDYGIYMVGNGRISVAGITTSNIDALCKAIYEVLQK